MFALVYHNGAVVLGQNARELLAGWAYEVRPDYLLITKTPVQCKAWQSKRIALTQATASPEQHLLRALWREEVVWLTREITDVQNVHEIA